MSDPDGLALSDEDEGSFESRYYNSDASTEPDALDAFGSTIDHARRRGRLPSVPVDEWRRVIAAAKRAKRIDDAGRAAIADLERELATPGLKDWEHIERSLRTCELIRDLARAGLNRLGHDARGKPIRQHPPLSRREWMRRDAGAWVGLDVAQELIETGKPKEDAYLAGARVGIAYLKERFGIKLRENYLLKLMYEQSKRERDGLPVRSWPLSDVDPILIASD